MHRTRYDKNSINNNNNNKHNTESLYSSPLRMLYSTIYVQYSTYSVCMEVSNQSIDNLYV